MYRITYKINNRNKKAVITAGQVDGFINRIESYGAIVVSIEEV